MKVVVEKTGEDGGQERFVLVNQKTGDAIVKSDVSEPSLRKYLSDIGESDKLIEECFRKARKRYDKAKQASGDENLDDIFSEIGIDDESMEDGG